MKSVLLKIDNDMNEPDQFNKIKKRGNWFARFCSTIFANWIWYSSIFSTGVGILSISNYNELKKWLMEYNLQVSGFFALQTWKIILSNTSKT